jgi:Tol biopolymer transport system component
LFFERSVAWQLAVFPIDNPGAVKVITPQPHFNLRGQIGWSPDGRALVVRSDQRGVGNLWLQPIDGSPPKQLTKFTSDFIARFAISRDGKHIAASRGNASLDVVLIKDFR